MEFDEKWLAGFFDGEGSIGIYARNYDRTKTKKYYVLVVSIAQSGNIGEQIISELEFRYGGSSYCQEKDGIKPQWKWNISADKASKFLENIMPYLVIKKYEAELGIRFQQLESKSIASEVAALLANTIKQCKVNY